MKSHPAYDLLDRYFQATFPQPATPSASDTPPVTAADPKAAKAQQAVAMEQAITEVKLDSALANMLLDMLGKSHGGTGAL